MTIGVNIKHTRRGLAAAAALIAAAIWCGAPAQAGISNGAAVGLGLGAFALGSAAASNPYYNPYYSPYAYPPPPGYYPPPAPAYYYPRGRSCWDPYYRRYYAC